MSARSQRSSLAVLAVLLPFLGACATAGRSGSGQERLDGYAEWRSGDLLVVDGQRVAFQPGAAFKGKGEANDFSSIPLGYEVKVRGIRQADGVLLADSVESKPNGSALFESQVRSLTDNAERTYRQAGRFYEESQSGQKTIGRLYESGPQAARVRRILNKLLPPYIDPGAVRTYVIENDEWNAMAMGNYSIYVFSGLMRDLDDDELAIVIGHELVHASHEHTRRQFKKAMWLELAALGVSLMAEEVDNKNERAIIQLLAGFTAMTMQNGYGRNLEDQADRVGLRYAYEGGFDVTKGPTLWNRFAKKYGEQGKTANFFFGSHSLASKRAVDLERELALNYPEGARTGVRQPQPTAFARAGVAQKRAVRASAPSASTRALALRGSSSGAGHDIRPGMSAREVRALLGKPEEIITVDGEQLWKYDDFSVVFEGGRVRDVEF